MGELSVVISAFNEEKNIKDCLESVKWADEIVFVDNTSTDQTVKIAQQYTKKIYTRPNYPMLNINKNFGFGKASGDWILNLDADERVTPELANEIKETMKQWSNETMGYWMPRKNIIFGKWIEHTGWYPDYQLRLFKKGKGRFAEKHVHEMLKVDGETSYLKEALIHLNYTSVAQFLYKLSQIYTPNEAQNILDLGKKLAWQDTIRMPIGEFFQRFFAQEGWKDGLHGLVLSLLMAFYHLVVFAKVWERQGFVETKINSQDLKKEVRKLTRELNYWLLTMELEETKNPLKKILFKIKRKVGF